VDDAVRYARLARDAGVSDMVKLEVLGDERTLFPDTAGLLEAARILIKEGFIVLPFTNDDLEAMVRKNMGQWFWIHRRWKAWKGLGVQPEDMP